MDPAVTRRAPLSLRPAPALVGAAIALAVIGSAVVYKTAGSMKALSAAGITGTLAPKARWIALEGLPEWVKPLADTLNYFAWIAVALGFGILIGAIVRSSLPARWLSRTLSMGGPFGIAAGAAIGAPLMLCSCCIAPVFDGAYARTRRLGPALALMIAAPGLNPADLAITWMVFPRGIALARLSLSLAAVAVAGAIGGMFRETLPPEANVIDEPAPSWSAWRASVAATLADTVRRSLPAMLAGTLLSAIIMQIGPLELSGFTASPVLAVLLAAVIATLLALPTFGEIPLGLALLAAGAPAGAVVAVLVAGPLINLPSLLVLRRATSWRVAAVVAGAVMILAFAGGLASEAWIT